MSIIAALASTPSSPRSGDGKERRRGQSHHFERLPLRGGGLLPSCSTVVPAVPTGMCLSGAPRGAASSADR